MIIDLNQDCIASADNRYRFWLSRRIHPVPNVGRRYAGVLWIMLNPSTARGVDINDPTQRRCVGFSERFGASRMGIINLFAKSSPDPKTLFAEGYDKAVGPTEQFDVWEEAIYCAKKWDWLTICAWGNANLPATQRGMVYIRAHSVTEWWGRPSLAGPGLYCLGLTGDRWPRHPLYLPSNCDPIPFNPTAMRN